MKNSPYSQSLGNRYGDDLRPVRPGRPSVRTPVVRLGGTKGDYFVPGPGAYDPSLVGKERASAWVMGDLKARKSSVEASADSPGPVYQMRSSVEAQTISNKVSSPRFGFGTQPRLKPDTTESAPGPGAYSPRVTHKSWPGSIQTVAVGQLTELTTPRGSVQMTEGTWSRMVNRSLATVREGPSSVTYSPRIDSSRKKGPAFTMRALGTRAFGEGGGEVSPGPLAYNPRPKSRFGDGIGGEMAGPSMASKDQSPRYISESHSRIYQGMHSPSPAAYTPLEQFGITSYTVSNTSTHAPIYAFGSEVRPCAP